MSPRATYLTPALYDYLLDVSLREPAVLKALREQTQTLPGSHLILAPEQGQFLALLIKLMNAVHTIDIGTYTGYSALAVALALPENGRVITCDSDQQFSKIADEYWQKAGVRKKIDYRIGKAADILNSLLITGHESTFDFIFIDADKRNYLLYYESALSLLKSGGLIAIDNVLWHGQVLDTKDDSQTTLSIQKFNQFLKDDHRVEISMIAIGDGLTLARKV